MLFLARRGGADTYDPKDSNQNTRSVNAGGRGTGPSFVSSLQRSFWCCQGSNFQAPLVRHVPSRVPERGRVRGRNPSRPGNPLNQDPANRRPHRVTRRDKGPRRWTGPAFVTPLNGTFD